MENRLSNEKIYDFVIKSKNENSSLNKYSTCYRISSAEKDFKIFKLDKEKFHPGSIDI
jgi:hypothetical protein